MQNVTSFSSKQCYPTPVPALGQLSPPRKLHVGPPLSASKMEGIRGFTQNAIVIQFYISCIFVRFVMNEPDGDGYESR